MRPQSDDVLKFSHYRKLDGSIERASRGRRNGRPVVFFPCDFHQPLSVLYPQADLQEQSKLFVNLNPLERETWRKILGAQSIASIAKEEGVSRAAIYSRIEGNSKGHGGMIGKNFWVLLWWRQRQRMTAGAR